MGASLAPQWIFQALTADGKVASGAKLYSFIAGTSTPTPLYADEALETPLANPLTLDAGGYGDFWADDSKAYRYRMVDSAGSLIKERDGVGFPYVKFSDLSNDTDPGEGAGLIGYKGRTVAARLGDIISVRDYVSLVVAGNWTAAFQAAIAAAGTDGMVVVPGYGYQYDIADTLVLPGGKLCGFGMPKIRWIGTDDTVDIFHLDGGSTEDTNSGNETIGAQLDDLFVSIGPSGACRDFAWIRYGDHAVIRKCVFSAGLRPCRDGIRIEPLCTPGETKTWYIENPRIQDTRASRLGRDGIRIAIPAKGIYEAETFVNLGKLDNVEIRGTGKNAAYRNTTDGVCAVRFLNACDAASTAHKISDWKIVGGEFQSSPYATGTADAPTFGLRCQHLDITKGGKTEWITTVGGTYERIEAGSLYAGSIGMDATNAIRVDFINPNVFGWAYTRSLEYMFAGNPTIHSGGVGLDYDAMRFGSVFMKRDVIPSPAFVNAMAVNGETTAGTWTPAFTLASFFRIGQLVFVQFQISGTLVGAAGNLRITRLPYTVHNDPSGAFAGAFSAGGHVEVMEGITFPANFTWATLRAKADAKDINLWRHGSAQNSTRVQASEVTGTLKLYGSIVYEARRFEDEDGVTYPKILWGS